MARNRVIVTGIKQVDRRLRKLAYSAQGKIVRPAMRAGLKVMATAVKGEVPVDTGATKSAVKVRAPKRRKRGNIEMEVVIKADDRLVKTSKAGKRTFYPAVVEYGSRKRGIKKNPFMHRAFATKGEAARQVTLRQLKAGVEKEVKSI